MLRKCRGWIAASYTAAPPHTNSPLLPPAHGGCAGGSAPTVGQGICRLPGGQGHPGCGPGSLVMLPRPSWHGLFLPLCFKSPCTGSTADPADRVTDSFVSYCFSG